MHATILLTPVMLTLTLLASCSSPPKPPTVNESRKRPVNTAMAVDLQVCKNDLHNTRLLATESGRIAEASAATLASISAHQRALAAQQRTEQPPQQANSVYTIQFAYGSSRVELPPDSTPELVDEAKRAPLVVLRGRTDGDIDTPAEARIAKERAAAVKDYLVAAGVDPSRIRPTYQSTGDHVVGNTNASGRALNRRVEVEVYRALPLAKALTVPSQATARGDHHG